MLRTFLYILCFILICINHLYASDETPSYSDAQIKAAYIIKIREFVNWPPETDKNVICLTEDDLMGSALAYILRSSGQNKNLKIVKKSLTSNFEECHILFIGQNSEATFSQILYSVSELPILTISDITNFVDRLGMIGFLTENRRVLLEVNLSEAKKRNLSISSKLLNVANRVID